KPSGPSSRPALPGRPIKTVTTRRQSAVAIGEYRRKTLFDFDLRSSRFDLLLDLFGFLLGDAFLNWFGSAFDQCFSLGQTEPRDRGADLLNHANFVRAHLL